MNRAILFSRRAENDLYLILNWLKKKSLRGAQNWRFALQDCLQEIAKDPNRFEKVTEASLLPQGIRQALFHTRLGNVYRIIFLDEPNEVRILRIRSPGQRGMRLRDLR